MIIRMMAYPEKYYPPVTPQTVQICSIQFSQTDRIRLNGIPNLPENLIPIIRTAIETGWVKGIQKEGDFHGAYEFKVGGNPWLGHGEDGVNARRLLSSILLHLAREGWVHLQSFDPSKKSNDKDTMFFEYQSPDPEAQIFAVSFNDTDKIRLIDTPSSSSWLLDTFRDTVKSSWPKGVQDERDYYGSSEIKLKGNPWFTSDGEQSVAAKLLLCQLIGAFRKIGYKLYASVDITGRWGNAASGGNSPTENDLDVWVLRRVTSIWY